MKVGAEPKKVALLVGLLLAAGYLYYTGRQPEAGESSPQGSGAPPAATSAAAGETQTQVETSAAARRPARTSSQGRIQEFRPSLRAARPEDRPDPMTIDPTLRLDLIEKLQEVKVDRVARSLFEFGAPPLPPEPKIVPAKIVEPPKAPEPAAAPVEPPPPQIPLKFFGYIDPAREGPKRAFFMEGTDIFVAGEGDLIRNRYKVVSIGVNTAVIEDTQFGHEQTFRLEERRG